MTLADYLRSPLIQGESCGEWVARWLDVSGIAPGLRSLLSRSTIDAVRAQGGPAVTAYAARVLHLHDFVPCAPGAVERGAPVVALTELGPTIGIAAGDGRTICRTARGSITRRWPVIAAWSAPCRN